MGRMKEYFMELQEQGIGVDDPDEGVTFHSPALREAWEKLDDALAKLRPAEPLPQDEVPF